MTTMHNDLFLHFTWVVKVWRHSSEKALYLVANVHCTNAIPSGQSFLLCRISTQNSCWWPATFIPPRCLTQCASLSLLFEDCFASKGFPGSQCPTWGVRTVTNSLLCKSCSSGHELSLCPAFLTPLYYANVSIYSFILYSGHRKSAGTFLIDAS